MNLRMKVLTLCLFLSIVVLVTGFYLLSSSHTDFSNQKPVAEFKADEFNQFVIALDKDERAGLGGNVYAVTGEVESLLDIGFILRGGIVCTTADSTDLGLLHGEEVRIKGRYISFDELFGEIRLDHVVTL